VIVLDVEQGSDDWYQARMGIVTGTGYGNILTPGTMKPSASAVPYMAKLLAEYITGEQQEKFSTADTERGQEMEPVACRMYEAITGNAIEHVGMVYRDEAQDRACSPDGLVIGRTKGLEIKCPQLKTHIGYVLKNVLPNDYRLQVHGCMYVCDVDSWDFMSFHPNFRPLLLTVDRDQKIDNAIHVAVDEFCSKLADEKAKIDASKIF
jgi:hypothetical protein